MSTGGKSTHWIEQIEGEPLGSPSARRMNIVQSSSKLSIFGELWTFMRVRKKWWLAPIVVTMILLSALIILTQGSAVAPFIYALF
jgi:hypothetical protein